MKTDEFAFVNQQLAAMLQDGLPLEGSLRQLCATMARGRLRSEFEQLEADLAKGTPLDDALAARKLPEFYKQMLKVGVASNDLPGMLTLLADYYQKVNGIWMRLKGLMVYPVIVLAATMALSILLSIVYQDIRLEVLPEVLGPRRVSAIVPVLLWVPPVLCTGLLAVALTAVGVPAVRRKLQWRLPSFREANLAKTAWAMTTMLQRGCPLPDALELLCQLERGTELGRDLNLWQLRLMSGVTRFPEIAEGSTVIPRLYSSMVGTGGENLAAGFRRTAEFYQGRAAYRADMVLYAALPVSVLVLGGLIFTQAVCLFVPLATCVGSIGQ